MDKSLLDKSFIQTIERSSGAWSRILGSTCVFMVASNTKSSMSIVIKISFSIDKQDVLLIGADGDCCVKFVMRPISTSVDGNACENRKFLDKCQHTHYHNCSNNLTECERLVLTMATVIAVNVVHDV